MWDVRYWLVSYKRAKAKELTTQSCKRNQSNYVALITTVDCVTVDPRSGPRKVVHVCVRYVLPYVRSVPHCPFQFEKKFAKI